MKAIQLPSGNWRVRVYDPTGEKPTTKSFTADTKTKAEFLAKQYEVEMKRRKFGLTAGADSRQIDNRKFGKCIDEWIDNRSNALSP